MSLVSLKGCGILLAVVFAVQLSWSQSDEEFERLMTRKRISCADIEENARFLIPGYHRSGYTDSIRYLLGYWVRNCGEEEPITRTTLLLDADAGTLARFPFSRLTVWNLLTFKRNTLYAKQYPERKERYTGTLFWRRSERVNDPFDLFTSSLAQEIHERSTDPFTQRIVQFYAGETDSLFSALYRNESGHPLLQSSYDSILTEIKDEFLLYMSVTAGVWIPNGNASLLGNHPELGFSLGGMRHGYSAELVILFRFLDASSPYVVRKNGVPTSTDHFFSGYIAGQFGLDVVQERSYDLSLLSGLGYDGFDAIAASNANANDNVSINSFNVNIGVGGRYYIEEFRTSFLSAEVRYHFVNYVNSGGTDLSGNAISFRIGYNLAPNWQYELLHELGAY